MLILTGRLMIQLLNLVIKANRNIGFLLSCSEK